MGTQENIQAVKDLYAAFDRGDIDAIINMVAEDVDWGTPSVASTEVPWLGVATGPAGVRGFFDAVAKEADVQVFERKEFVASGNHVAVRYRAEYIVKKNGQKVAEEGLHFWAFNQDGMIATLRQHGDTAAELLAWRG